MARTSKSMRSLRSGSWGRPWQHGSSYSASLLNFFRLILAFGHVVGLLERLNNISLVRFMNYISNEGEAICMSLANLLNISFTKKLPVKKWVLFKSTVVINLEKIQTGANYSGISTAFFS